VTRPRPVAVRRGVVVATWAAVAVAAIAAVRVAADRAARPPTRCPSELTSGGAVGPTPDDPRALARSGR